MPLYEVVELRMLEATYLIDAEDEDAAKALNGHILEDDETDSWGYDVQSVHRVDEETL